MKGYQNKDELESKYYELKSMKKVADYYGVSKKLILNHIKKFGIVSIDHSVKINANEVIDLLKSGLTLKEVAKKLSVSVGTIQNKLKPLGIKTDYFHKGYKKTEGGYILIRKPDHPKADKSGYVREHILVMEQHIGRYLRDDEVVHHKNRNKSDNRIENLELMTAFNHKQLHSLEEKKKIDLELVRRLLDEGYFLEEVSKLFNMSPSGLRKKLQRNNMYVKLTPKVNQYTKDKYTKRLKPVE